jgi:hypothetical protein
LAGDLNEFKGRRSILRVAIQEDWTDVSPTNRCGMAMHVEADATHG